MWIALAVIGVLATLITVILLLPVKVIIKSDENGQLMLRYRLFFKTFGENPNPDDPIVKMLLTASGVERFKKEQFQKNIRVSGLKETLAESYTLLVGLLKELVFLLKRCTVTKLHIKIRCTGDGPDEAAIHYGESCAVTYSTLNLLRNFVKIRKRGCHVDISCDFFGSEGVFQYDVVLAVSFARVLAALWRVALEEAKRMNTQKNG